MASTVSPTGGRESVRVISRHEWGAVEPKPTEEAPITKISLPMDHVCFGHTAGDTCSTTEECMNTVKQLQSTNMNDSGLPDICFNFLIGGDGVVYEGRGWDNEPHRPLLNQFYEGRGIEIGYIGNYKDICPSPNMVKTGFNFMLYGLKKGLIKQHFQTLHLA